MGLNCNKKRGWRSRQRVGLIILRSSVRTWHLAAFVHLSSAKQIKVGVTVSYEWPKKCAAFFEYAKHSVYHSVYRCTLRIAAATGAATSNFQWMPFLFVQLPAGVPARRVAHVNEPRHNTTRHSTGKHPSRRSPGAPSRWTVSEVGGIRRRPLC